MLAISNHTRLWLIKTHRPTLLIYVHISFQIKLLAKNRLHSTHYLPAQIPERSTFQMRDWKTERQIRSNLEISRGNYRTFCMNWLYHLAATVACAQAATASDSWEGTITRCRAAALLVSIRNSARQLRHIFQEYGAHAFILKHIHNPYARTTFFVHFWMNCKSGFACNQSAFESDSNYATQMTLRWGRHGRSISMLSARSSIFRQTSMIHQWKAPNLEWKIHTYPFATLECDRPQELLCRFHVLSPRHHHRLEPTEHLQCPILNYFGSTHSFRSLLSPLSFFSRFAYLRLRLCRRRRHQ